MNLIYGIDRRLIYLAAMLAAFAITAWASFIVEVPNPDALTYLRSAEHFANGDFRAAIGVYRWPFYSLLIAWVHLATGLGLLVSAHLLDALFLAITFTAFIALVERLFPERRLLLALAAIIIVLHPKLMEMRSALIRDHGFHAFYLAALYFTVRDLQAPRLWSKLAIVFCAGLATLFRFEGALLFLLVPAFYLFERARMLRTRLVVVGAVAALILLAFPAYIVWTGVIHRLISGAPIDLTTIVTWHINTISNRIEWLRAVIPAGRNTGEFAYFGATVLIFSENVLRAVTYPLALLAVFAFWPRRLMPPFVNRFVAWFVLWQVPILLIFTVFQLYLDWRYAMGLAFIAAIPALVTIETLVGEWRAGMRRAYIALPVLAVFVIVSAAANLPMPSRNLHLKKAGIWIAENLPRDAIIATNEARIAFFSGRPYPEEIRTYFKAAELDWNVVDYAAVDIGRSDTPPKEPLFQSIPVIARIDGDNGEGSVLIYQVKPD